MSCSVTSIKHPHSNNHGTVLFVTSCDSCEICLLGWAMPSYTPTIRLGLGNISTDISDWVLDTASVVKAWRTACRYDVCVYRCICEVFMCVRMVFCVYVRLYECMCVWRTYVCMCECTCVCRYVCMYVCMYVYVYPCIYLFMYVCMLVWSMHACMHECMYEGMNPTQPRCLWLAECSNWDLYVCVCVCIHLCVYVFMCLCVYACVYVCTRVCMYACMYVGM